MTSDQKHKDEQAIQPHVSGDAVEEIPLRPATDAVQVSPVVEIQPAARTRNWVQLVGGLLFTLVEVFINRQLMSDCRGRGMGRRRMRRRRRNGCA